MFSIAATFLLASAFQSGVNGTATVREAWQGQIDGDKRPRKEEKEEEAWEEK